eukprot:6718100-Pyramimonas_sp.AAC.1
MPKPNVTALRSDLSSSATQPRDPRSLIPPPPSEAPKAARARMLWGEGEAGSIIAATPLPRE